MPEYNSSIELPKASFMLFDSLSLKPPVLSIEVLIKVRYSLAATWILPLIKIILLLILLCHISQKPGLIHHNILKLMSPSGNGRNPSPSGDYFSRLAELWKIIARPAIVSMTSKYHLVWITKYRKPVLSKDIATRLRDLIREICKTMDIEILKGHVSSDHVQLFVSVLPYHSVSQIMKRIKGKTSRQAVE